MKKIRILLADDHQIVREGLRLLMNQQRDLKVVGEAGDGREACDQALRLKPDVVVLDLSMPGMNGLQAATALHQDCPQIKVVALTVHEDESYLRQLLQSGIAGYVLKRSAGDELILAIRKVMRGEVHFDATVAGKTLEAQQVVSPAGGKAQPVKLSQREKTVLYLLAWGYGNKEIASRLQLSVKTIETYKVRVAEKLNLHSRAEMVRYAMREGWLNETYSFTQLT